MRRRHKHALSCAVLAALVGAAIIASRSDSAHARLSRDPLAHAAIVGGQLAPDGAFPWLAKIFDREGERLGACSGTVIAANLVLTAGHCAEDITTGVARQPSGYRVITGAQDWNAPEPARQISGVSSVIVCPCFDRSTNVGDVALLQLSTPTRAPAVPLALSAAAAGLPFGGTAAVMTGWGLTAATAAEPSEQLRWAPTVIQRLGWCDLEAPPFSSSSEICTINPPDRRTGACHGDSGGPLLVAQPGGGMVQVGVASHGYDACATTLPDVYTRVDAVAAWVNAWEQALQPGVPPRPSAAIAPPELPGVAIAQPSGGVRRGTVTFTLECDAEGGACSGVAELTSAVRERLIRRSGSRRRTISTAVHRAVLARASFQIAPGLSAAVHVRLAQRMQALIPRRGTLSTLLIGTGLSPGIVRLKREHG